MKRFDTKVFAPEQPSGPSHVGVVMVNTAGATVRETKCFYGDTNGDAQHLADTHGVTVIGVDRPISGVRFPNPLAIYGLLSDPSHEFSKLQRDIDDIVAARGLKRLIVTGRSVAGLGALELGRFGPSEVVACEPGGMYEQPLFAGYAAYQKYNAAEHAALKQGSLDLAVLPEQSDQVGFVASARRVGTFTIGNLVDTLSYSALLASDRGAKSAEFIAKNLPQTHLRLLFAEHSLVAPKLQAADYEAYLQDQRAQATDTNGQDTVADIRVEQYVSTSHISFNNRGWMAELLRPSIERQAEL